MTKLLTLVTLLGASLTAQIQPVNQVVQWNRTLLAIVRTAGHHPPYPELRDYARRDL